MLAPLNQCSLVKNTRSSGLQVLEGRCLQRPGSRKRLPSKDFGVDDNQMKIRAKLRDLRCQQCKALLERLMVQLGRPSLS
jgi:hypothetical protein